MASVYIETTIPSYLVSRPSRDLLTAAHQQVTQDWWEFRRHEFELFVSQVVLEEASAGDPDFARKRMELISGIPVLALTNETRSLTELLIRDAAIPTRAAADAAHIAVASVHGCDYLLTWNCRHIANAQIRGRFGRIVQSFGFELPAIATPEELMGGGE